MADTQQSPVWPVLGFLTLVVLFISVLLVVQELIGDPLERHNAELAQVPEVPTRPSAGTATEAKIEHLACFRCHSLVEFHKGDPDQAGSDDEGNVNPKAFSHDLHAKEGLVHCHRCHAFEGHFQVTTRMKTCEECH
ncbi:MAG: hypothetical protein AMXMBFR64_38770 [Myxococcales bacterium]